MSEANDKQIGGDHYKQRKFQHWDYAAQLPYLDGQVSKYIDRHRSKNGFQDLLKAKHYLEKMMEVYYPEQWEAHLEKEAAEALSTMQRAVELTDKVIKDIDKEENSFMKFKKLDASHKWIAYSAATLICSRCGVKDVSVYATLPCEGLPIGT